MTTKKKLEDLTLKDNFMFGAVMIHPANCKPFLEMALGIPIGKLTVSMEKSLIYHPEYKGVRQIKANREMEEKFMLLEELLMDEREAGRAEGLEAGRAKGLAEAVLDLLQELSGEIPEDLKGQILAEKDSSILRHYLKTVSSAGSVEEFMAKLSH